MQWRKSGGGETLAGATTVPVELPAVKTKGAAGRTRGDDAAVALALNTALDVGVFDVGVFGAAATGTLGARVIGNPSNALGSEKGLAAAAAAAAGAGGLGAGGERDGSLEGVVVGSVNAAAAAMALPRGVFLGVTPLRNTCTRANSWGGAGGHQPITKCNNNKMRQVRRKRFCLSNRILVCFSNRTAAAHGAP
jgi:hypothetical protein